MPFWAAALSIAEVYESPEPPWPWRVRRRWPRRRASRRTCRRRRRQGRRGRTSPCGSSGRWRPTRPWSWGLEAQVLEDVGAVVQGADADVERGAVHLAVDRDGLLRGRVGVLGLAPRAEVLGDVEESAVLHIAGRVGVAVLHDVGRGLRVVEGGLHALGAGVDRDVLDVDLGVLVRLLEGGDHGVDDLRLRIVADLLEEPHPQGAALVVLVGGRVVGGLGRAAGDDSGGRHEYGESGGELHGAFLRESGRALQHMQWAFRSAQHHGD